MSDPQHFYVETVTGIMKMTVWSERTKAAQIEVFTRPDSSPPGIPAQHLYIGHGELMKLRDLLNEHCKDFV